MKFESSCCVESKSSSSHPASYTFRGPTSEYLIRRPPNLTYKHFISPHRVLPNAVRSEWYPLRLYLAEGEALPLALVRRLYRNCKLQRLEL